MPPHGTGVLALGLPADWRRHDALYVTATDPWGREVYTWTWMIADPGAVAERVVRGGEDRASGTERGGEILLEAGGTVARVDAATGRLLGATRDGSPISLGDGPRLAEGDATPKALRHYADGSDYVVEATYEGNLRRVRWRMLPGGWLRLDYAYHFGAGANPAYLGVTFDYPEGGVKAMRWLGKGPYRVWKNRLEGVEFDVWRRGYNDAVTGYRWDYPEFKGFHDDVYWAALETTEGTITAVVASPDVALRLLTPSEPEGKAFDPRTTRVRFPPGDLSFLHGIAPVGTKFDPASSHGPAGGPNIVPRLGRTFEGTVFFGFRAAQP